MHFSLEETGGTSVTRIGTVRDSVIDVPIPDAMLENEENDQNYKIYAFVYLAGNGSGNTEYKITIPVKARPKPEIPGTPEKPELFRETIETVNAAAEKAEMAQKQAETWAHDMKVIQSVIQIMRNITLNRQRKRLHLFPAE